MKKETRNLILFFVATISATCAAYFTIVLQGWSPYEMPGLILFLIGGSAPSWVGLLMVLFTYNKDQRRDYFKRLLPRLIPGRWWAIIILINLFVYVIVYAIVLLMGGSLPGMESLKVYIAQPWILPLALLLGLGSGPIAEEFGWRGYALDPMINRFGSIPGSILLGLIWGVWHIGLFFMPQTWHASTGFAFAGFYTFVLGSVGSALVMTWIYVNTNRSILAAILTHFFINFTGNTLAPHSENSYIIRMIVLIVLGLILCLSLERKTRRQVAVTNG